LHPGGNQSATTATAVPDTLPGSRGTHMSSCPESTTAHGTFAGLTTLPGSRATSIIPESLLALQKNHHRTDIRETGTQNESDNRDEQDDGPFGPQSSDDDLSDPPEDLVDPREEPVNLPKAGTTDKIHGPCDPSKSHTLATQPGI
jgi:hypothetical protein